MQEAGGKGSMFRCVRLAALEQTGETTRTCQRVHKGNFHLERADTFYKSKPMEHEIIYDNLRRDMEMMCSSLSSTVQLMWSDLWQSVTLPTSAGKKETRKPLIVEHDARLSQLDRALICSKNMNLKGAIDELEEAIQSTGPTAELLSLLSKQWTDHTYLDGATSDQVLYVNRKAITLAKRAQDMDPACSIAHAAESISKGRMAIAEPNPRKKLTLAKEAQEAAYTALEFNSQDDVALHLIGRWNVGMAGLNIMVKVCIKYVFGANFRPGTMENALECYEHAVTLRPDRVPHRVELARCYWHFGRRDEALHHLLLSFDLPLEDVNGRQMLQEGAQLLKEVDPTHDIDKYQPLWDTSTCLNAFDTVTDMTI